ncbi:unnamed protein product, partial [marine sediment metagenome]
MAMFERRLFNKPIAVTIQNMEAGQTEFFQIPWNKIGYLKRIEIGRTCAPEASGCFTFEIWDDFEDGITETS